jgi:preprotein translocase subunit YajC
MTLGGLYGTIVDTDDESITIEVAPGVTNRYAKGAIARVVTPADQVADEVDEDDEVDEEYVEESDAAVEPELADAAEESDEDESPAKKTKKEEVVASNQALPRDPTAN